MVSTHFSKPLSARGGAPAPSRLSQLPAMYPVTPDELRQPAHGEASHRASVDSGSSWLDLETAETALSPADQAELFLDPHVSNRPLSSISGEKDKQISGPRSSMVSLPSASSHSEYSALPPPQAKNARYYDHALSTSDHDALIRGEYNHNLRPYTPRDVIMHHESRKELVPQGTGTNKLRKMEALAKIEQEKQHSQQVLERNKVSQSMHDLRAPHTQAPKRLTIVPPGVSRQFSFQATPTAMTQPSHARMPSAGDYFSSRPVAQQPPSSPPFPSPPTPRVRSPLAPQTSMHRHNPSATFDAFLVPHKTGKGEAFRGTSTAKKPKAVKEKHSSASIGALRRLSMMPSMQSLKICKSRGDLRKDSLEASDVSPLPGLPEYETYVQR